MVGAQTAQLRQGNLNYHCARIWRATLAPGVDVTEATWRDMSGRRTWSCHYAKPPPHAAHQREKRSRKRPLEKRFHECSSSIPGDGPPIRVRHACAAIHGNHAPAGAHRPRSGIARNKGWTQQASRNSIGGTNSENDQTIGGRNGPVHLPTGTAQSENANSLVPAG